MVKDYKELDIWKQGMDIVQDVYVSTKGFPKDEV